jgi:hypothetical protein
MATFNRSDLAYIDYKWTALSDHDNPKWTGKPDSTLLNKTEGYEMLYFINRYMEKKGYVNTGTGQKIEKLIRSSTTVDKSHAYWTDYVNSNLKL